LQPAIALQAGDTIAYTYNYTASGNYSTLYETATGSLITIPATPVMNNVLATPAFTLFVFVQDVLGN